MNATARVILAAILAVAGGCAKQSLATSPPASGLAAVNFYIDQISAADDPTSASEAYTQALAVATDSAALHKAYMERMLAMGQPQLANDAAVRLAKLEPRNGRAWAVMAYVFGQSDQPAEAMAAIVQAVKAAPADALVLTVAGQLIARYDLSDEPPELEDSLREEVADMADKLADNETFAKAYKATMDLAEQMAKAASQRAADQDQATGPQAAEGLVDQTLGLEQPVMAEPGTIYAGGYAEQAYPIESSYPVYGEYAGPAYTGYASVEYFSPVRTYAYLAPYGGGYSPFSYGLYMSSFRAWPVGFYPFPYWWVPTRVIVIHRPSHHHFCRLGDRTIVVVLDKERSWHWFDRDRDGLHGQHGSGRRDDHRAAGNWRDSDGLIARASGNTHRNLVRSAADVSIRAVNNDRVKLTRDNHLLADGHVVGRMSSKAKEVLVQDAKVLGAEKSFIRHPVAGRVELSKDRERHPAGAGAKGGLAEKGPVMEKRAVAEKGAADEKLAAARKLAGDQKEAVARTREASPKPPLADSAAAARSDERKLSPQTTEPRKARLDEKNVGLAIKAEPFRDAKTARVQAYKTQDPSNEASREDSRLGNAHTGGTGKVSAPPGRPLDGVTHPTKLKARVASPRENDNSAISSATATQSLTGRNMLAHGEAVGLALAGPSAPSGAAQKAWSMQPRSEPAAVLPSPAVRVRDKPRTVEAAPVTEAKRTRTPDLPIVNDRAAAERMPRTSDTARIIERPARVIERPAPVADSKPEVRPSRREVVVERASQEQRPVSSYRTETGERDRDRDGGSSIVIEQSRSSSDRTGTTAAESLGSRDSSRRAGRQK